MLKFRIEATGERKGMFLKGRWSSLVSSLCLSSAGSLGSLRRTYRFFVFSACSIFDRAPLRRQSLYWGETPQPWARTRMKRLFHPHRIRTFVRTGEYVSWVRLLVRCFPEATFYRACRLANRRLARAAARLARPRVERATRSHPLGALVPPLLELSVLTSPPSPQPLPAPVLATRGQVAG